MTLALVWVQYYCRLGADFWVKKFHIYLYGRGFTIVTDRKPLTTILGPKKGILPLAAAHLQRWAVLPPAHDYQTEFKPTQSHGSANGLSPLLLKSARSEEGPSELHFFNTSQTESLPVTFIQLQKATRTDVVLGKAIQYTKHGWPQEVEAALRPFWTRRQELTVKGDCLMWASAW